MIVVDTSVAVAAALPWHEAHAVARSALPRTKTQLVAQVAVETYSVLTRLPPPQRVSPATARAYLSGAFGEPPIVLSAKAYAGVLDLAADEGIAGGAIYDALIGATAKEAGATLLSLDRRAIGIYQILRVDYRVIS